MIAKETFVNSQMVSIYTRYFAHCLSPLIDKVIIELQKEESNDALDFDLGEKHSKARVMTLLQKPNTKSARNESIVI